MTAGVRRSGLAGWLGHAVQQWLRLPRALRWLLPVAIMAVLWWSSSQPPGAPGGVLRALVHNAMHIVAYGALAAAFRLALGPAQLASPAARATVAAVMLTIAYGVVDELHQSRVGRVCSLADVLSDTLGAALAVTGIDGLATGAWRWRRIAMLLLLSAITVGWATFG